MVSHRCKLMVKEKLKKLGLLPVEISLGEVEIHQSLSTEDHEQLRAALLASGLEIIDDKKAILIEKIRNVIVQMVHHTEEKPEMNFSNFLSEQLDYDYPYLSSLFSEATGVTIEQFIITNKIERAKELIIYDELNLTEIAFKLHYSSVAHLSRQFKKVTGLTPSFFRQLKENKRKTLENS
jgi:AraC-like DNA-binding protein